jgi:hypothetical protein
MLAYQRVHQNQFRCVIIPPMKIAECHMYTGKPRYAGHTHMEKCQTLKQKALQLRAKGRMVVTCLSLPVENSSCGARFWCQNHMWYVCENHLRRIGKITLAKGDTTLQNFTTKVWIWYGSPAILRQIYHKNPRNSSKSYPPNICDLILI